MAFVMERAVGMQKPPRRVRTAYAYFVQDHYRQTARQMGTRQPQPVIRALGQMWRNMTQQERQIYLDREIRDRERYRLAKAEYARLFGGRVPRMRRKRKERDAPRRTRNAFIFFEREIWKIVRMEHPEMRQQEMVREIARRWREMPEVDKAEYRQRAQNDRQRYNNELREYKLAKARNIAESRVERLLEGKAAAQPQQGAAAQPRQEAAAQPQQGAAAQPQRGAAAQPQQGAAVQPQQGGAAQPGKEAAAEPQHVAAGELQKEAAAQPPKEAAAQPGLRVDQQPANEPAPPVDDNRQQGQAIKVAA